jgi:L-rhamnose mutarotase
MTRMAMGIGIDPDGIDDYRRLHAAVWPEVLARLTASNITDYTIYLRQPENLLFASWDYRGADFAADSAAIAADPVTRKWWALCNPLQRPLASCKDGEWWAPMEEVFRLD